MFCPLCGESLECVDSTRLERENKPDGWRCVSCGQGWEILIVNEGLLVSEANKFSFPGELKLFTGT